MIVEVILASDFCALGFENPRERVANCGPAGSADVNWSGWIRRDELEIHLHPGHGGRSTIARACFNNGLGQFAGSGSAQREIYETWAGDVDLGDCIKLF